MQEFDPSKLARSLIRAGADESTASQIAQEIASQIREGMTTHEIYSRAFALLRTYRGRVAAHYSLKRAMLEFGPTGFPFEKYLAEIFRARGYTTVTDQHIPGRCVEHEVDVVMTKDDPRETVYVEAKFHNTIGFKTDLQVALYVQARTEDIIAARGETATSDHRIRGMLATNTKFTDLAMQYAICRDLALISWDYPEKGNLHDLTSQAGLYPITALSSLNHSAKETLLSNNVVLCRDVLMNKDVLAQAGVPERRIPAVVSEAAGLCNA